MPEVVGARTVDSRRRERATERTPALGLVGGLAPRSAVGGGEDKRGVGRAPGGEAPRGKIGAQWGEESYAAMGACRCIDLLAYGDRPLHEDRLLAQVAPAQSERLAGSQTGVGEPPFSSGGRRAHARRVRAVAEPRWSATGRESIDAVLLFGVDRSPRRWRAPEVRPQSERTTPQQGVGQDLWQPCRTARSVSAGASRLADGSKAFPLDRRG